MLISKFRPEARLLGNIPPSLQRPSPWGIEAEDFCANLAFHKFLYNNYKLHIDVDILKISPGPNSNDTFDHYPFLAYAPSGTVEADLIYANFGRDQDFQKLAEMNVTVRGNIVIIRSRNVSIHGLSITVNQIRHWLISRSTTIGHFQKYHNTLCLSLQNFA